MHHSCPALSVKGIKSLHQTEPKNASRVNEYSSFYILINSMYLTQKLKSGYTYMVPQIKAGELKFLVGWRRVRSGRRRRRRGRLSRQARTNKSGIIAGALEFSTRLRQCMTFVNKICSHMSLRDASSARLLQFFR